MAENEVIYSICIPVYNSEYTVRELYERIAVVFKDITDCYEIIMVDDCSTDGSWEVLKQINAEDGRIKIIQLRQNAGQHNALMCAFNYIRGQYVITIDDDLQNPPEEIPKLINKIADEDCDVVFADFIGKKHHFLRNMGSKLVQWIAGKIFNKPSGLVTSNFRITKSDIIREVVSYKLANPYISGLILRETNNCVNVKTLHEERKVGKSNYTFGKLLKLVFSLLFNFSDFPLRIAIYLGILFSGLGFLISLVVLIKNILHGSTVQGWTSLVLIMSVFSSIILIIIGALGEYVVRIVEHVDGKKQYIIRNKSGDFGEDGRNK